MTANLVDHQGWLCKWTNYLRRYKKRWFVIQNGFLSYYRSTLTPDAQRVPSCRGMWCMSDSCVLATGGTCTFVFTCGPKTLYLKASSEVEKLRWINALEFAKSKAQSVREGPKVSVDYSESDDASLESTDEDEFLSTSSSRKRECSEMATSKPLQPAKVDEVEVFKTPDGSGFNGKTETKQLYAKLSSLEECYSALQATYAQLARTALELDADRDELHRRDAVQLADFSSRVHSIAIEVSNLRVSSATLVRNAGELTYAARHAIARYDAALRRETSRCVQLETIIEQLASDQNRIEKCISRRNRRDGEKAPPKNAAPLRRVSTYQVGMPESKPPPEIIRTSETSSLSSDESFDDAHYYDALDDAAFNDAAFGAQDPMQLVPVQNSEPNHLGHSRGHGHVRSRSDWDDSTKRNGDTAGDCNSTPPSPRLAARHTSLCAGDLNAEEEDEKRDKSRSKDLVVPTVPARQRRTCIPPRPQAGGSIWSILRQCLGKELTRIPIPVQFCEPVSILQRSAEDFEYTQLLDRAAACSDPIEQMALVAAFSVSSYASTPKRLLKPFNPILGETYEMDRSGEPGFDWRLMSEQISHHPPIMAMVCESRSAGWRCWMEIRLNTRFRAKAILIEPSGLEYVEFREGPLRGSLYTWNRAVTAVHNIILGKMWLENVGDVEVIEHTRGINCHLTYMPHSYFRREAPHNVLGVVTDREGTPRYALQGSWHAGLTGAFILSENESASVTSSLAKKDSPGPSNTLDLNAALHATSSSGSKRSSSTANSSSALRLSQTHLLWTSNAPLAESQRMYNFSKYTIELNEPEPDAAPTDSRWRADIRVMESGDFEGSNREKYRIEEKQRAMRRERERMQKADPEHAEQYEARPRWFAPQHDAITNKTVHKFTDKYWIAKANRDWTGCPNLF